MLLTSDCHGDIVEAGAVVPGEWTVSWNLTNISTLAGLIVASLAIIGKVTGGFAWVWKKVGVNSSALLVVPNKTLILVRDGTPGASRYSLDIGGRGVSMHAACDVKATNVFTRPVQIVAARIHKPVTHGTISIRSAGGWGKQLEGHAIPSGETLDVRVEFLVESAPWPKRGSFTADIVLIDQFGNEHWLRVRFEQVPAAQISSQAT